MILGYCFSKFGHNSRGKKNLIFRILACFCRSDSPPARPDPQPPSVWDQPVFWRGVAWWETEREEADYGSGKIEKWSLIFFQMINGMNIFIIYISPYRTSCMCVIYKQKPHNKVKLQLHFSSHWGTTELLILLTLLFMFRVYDHVTHTGILSHRSSQWWLVWLPRCFLGTTRDPSTAAAFACRFQSRISKTT